MGIIIQQLTVCYESMYDAVEKFPIPAMNNLQVKREQIMEQTVHLFGKFVTYFAPKQLVNFQTLMKEINYELSAIMN